MPLYHASQQQNLEKIMPQRTLSYDKYIGDYVFATKNRVIAAMYLVPKGFAILLHTKGEKPILVISGTEEQLRQKDKGGAIYELPEETFVDTPQAGLELYERVSSAPVTPSGVSRYNSIMDAFNESNILVKFTDDQTFKLLIESPEQERLIEEL